MSIQFKKYKRIFRRNLQPVFAILVQRKNALDFSAWQSYLDETLLHVANNPVEYLGTDLPDRRLMADILEEIRAEFVKEMIAFKAVPRH